jgi:UDP-2,3-diacylglucosamine hydrolase
MSHKIELKEGAFIIADAHYSHLRPKLLAFIKDIYLKKFQPTQLILMGDIFDALFGLVPYTSKINQEIIELLNKISLEIELIYLEGNHDFNLKNIFPHAKVFPISKQPVACGFNGKKLYFAHGDLNGAPIYQIYTSIIRNKIVLSILSIIDLLSNHAILRKLDNYLAKKDDCNKFRGFEKFIFNRLDGKFKCDYFIEGHFHQNKMVTFENFTYINLGAFACNQRFFIVKSNEDVELLQESSY